MKKIIASSLIFLSIISYSQLIIGDAVGTVATSNKGSVLLEFADTRNKGILLPTVRTLPTAPAEGTILLDGSSPTTARVKYYNGTWQDLSGKNGDVTAFLSNQPTTAENANSKAIIGAKSSTADGVLVLESNTKAMVLPRLNTVDNIINPSPGMMVYINKSGAKRLAVYNGTVWSFWKP